MPIRDENRSLYGDNWREFSATLRAASDWTCEGCGRKHGAPIFESPQLLLPLDLGPPRRRRGLVKNVVVLSVAHLDQDPSNHAPDNLSVLCMSCHLEFDKLPNLLKRRATTDARRREREQYQGVLRFSDVEEVPAGDRPRRSRAKLH